MTKAEKIKRWREENPDKVKAHQRKYNAKNKEAIKKIRTEYRLNNPEKFKGYKDKFIQNNREEINRKKRDINPDLVQTNIFLRSD